MKDFAIEWYKERAKQPKYQSQVNESNLANITDQINRAEYVEPSKFYSNPNVYKGKVGNVTQAAQVAMRQNKGAEGLSLDGVANNRCITKQQFNDNLPSGGYC